MEPREASSSEHVEDTQGSGEKRWAGDRASRVSHSVPSTASPLQAWGCAGSKEQNSPAPQRSTDGPKGLELDIGIEFGPGIEFRS